MAGSNRYFLYVSATNLADARTLLSNRSIQYTEADAIQDGIKELSFTAEPDIVQSIAQEVFNGNAKVYFSDKKLAITGSIGTIAATITATDMRTGSTDNTAGNATYIKTASDGTLVLPTLPTGSNTIGNVGLNTGSNTIGNVGINTGTNSIGKVTLNNLVARAASHSNANMGTSSATVVASNSGRKALLIENDSDTIIYLKIGGTAVANEGIRLNANGGSYEMSLELGNLATDAVNGIVSSGSSKKVLVTEYS